MVFGERVSRASRTRGQTRLLWNGMWLLRRGPTCSSLSSLLLSQCEGVFVPKSVWDFGRIQLKLVGFKMCFLSEFSFKGILFMKEFYDRAGEQVMLPSISPSK